MALGHSHRGFNAIFAFAVRNHHEQWTSWFVGFPLGTHATHGLDKREEIELYRELVESQLRKNELAYHRLYYQYWNEYLIGRIPCADSSTVLEVGCSVGVLLGALSERFDRVVGLDISRDSLAVVESTKWPGVSLIAGDAESLPLLDGSVDAVVLRGALHHLPNMPEAVTELARVLKPGGYLLLCETCDDAVLARVLRFLYLSVYTRMSSSIEKDHPSLHSTDLLPAIRLAGLEVKRAERFGYVAYPLASMPEHVPILKFAPFSVFLTRALIWLDTTMSRMPLIRSQGWTITVLAQKRSPSAHSD